MRVVPVLVFAAILAEIVGILFAGHWLGVLPVILLLLFDVFAGVSIIRATGLDLSQAMKFGNGQPEQTSNLAASSLMRFIAGLLLIAPGFLSDAAALALLVPAFQRWVARRFTSRVDVRSAQWTSSSGRDGPIIEGEAIEIQGRIPDPEHESDRN
jgi:UPF0716 protein FxsA